MNTASENRRMLMQIYLTNLNGEILKQKFVTYEGNSYLKLADIFENLAEEFGEVLESN